MQHERRCSCARGEDVSFRDVKIKIPDRKIWPGDVNDVMHWKRVRRILGIWEKSVSRILASEEDSWLSGLTEALRQVSHMVWGRWKSQHRKNVYLSPYVKKSFNSKVINSFVPELRSPKCFSCFEIPMLSMCVMDIINVLHSGMNTSISHIHVWLCNTVSMSKKLVSL